MMKLKLIPKHRQPSSLSAFATFLLLVPFSFLSFSLWWRTWRWRWGYIRSIIGEKKKTYDLFHIICRDCSFFFFFTRPGKFTWSVLPCTRPLFSGNSEPNRTQSSPAFSVMLQTACEKRHSHSAFIIFFFGNFDRIIGSFLVFKHRMHTPQQPLIRSTAFVILWSVVVVAFHLVTLSNPNPHDPHCLLLHFPSLISLHFNLQFRYSRSFLFFSLCCIFSISPILPFLESGFSLGIGNSPFNLIFYFCSLFGFSYSLFNLCSYP